MPRCRARPRPHRGPCRCAPSAAQTGRAKRLDPELLIVATVHVPLDYRRSVIGRPAVHVENPEAVPRLPNPHLWKSVRHRNPPVLRSAQVRRRASSFPCLSSRSNTSYVSTQTRYGVIVRPPLLPLSLSRSCTYPCTHDAIVTWGEATSDDPSTCPQPYESRTSA